MKTLKLSLAVVCLICSALCSATAAPKIQKVNQMPVGVPYSLEYIAKHSPNGKAQGYFGNRVNFYEGAASPSVYRTYDWEVDYYQDGVLVYSFATNDYSLSWTNYYSVEKWLGPTGAPDVVGTYTVIIKDISGVGGTYDGSVGFINANGQPEGVWVQDIITNRSDMVFENVYVNGVDDIDIEVNKTAF